MVIKSYLKLRGKDDYRWRLDKMGGGFFSIIRYYKPLVVQNVLFGLEDIVYMTGLNVDGDAVSGWDGDFEGVCQTYLRKEGKVGKTGCVSLAWLRKNFKNVPTRALDDPEEFFCYVRAYVLFIIGCFVCPDPSRKFVSISFLRLLNTKEDFNRYAWGAALLAHLHWSLDSFFNPKTKGNLAGHSYSLMRVPRLGLYLMENREPDESDITTFKKGRPVEFPLLRGWGEKLHHVTHDNHDGKDTRSFAGILRTVSPDEIEWQPYQRLGADFLPQHLMGQEVMGLSQTILLCFSSAVHHFPNKCSKQFGLAKAHRTTQQPLMG
ncbi:hypothetical protein Vadar_012674 [Vaccinium darrowii]|uniref:Uncharacterized protein n=1 Tax=Vaccinium darrowii TaxID=229202 RepID=A0ACB7Y6N9_9ERIC|nr:hypothetical protein Vadar_012674 [Vaccinium darrowii]